MEKSEELTSEEMEKVIGGKTSTPDGITEFIAWALCGFSHNYVVTGRTKTALDVGFRIKFYELKCTDCHHSIWRRGDPPVVEEPQTNQDGGCGCSSGW